jgi:ankyrin repeat protein
MNFERRFTDCAVHNDFNALFDATLLAQPSNRRAVVHKNFFNQVDEHGSGPLHYAASVGDIRASEVLLAHGAHPDLPDKHGFTALMWASEKGHLDIVQTLVDKYRASVNQQNENGETALFLAVSSGHDAVVRYLLVNGADANVASVTDECNTPLQCAVASDRLDLVELLLNFGAWLEQQDLAGETALHLAVREEKVSLVEYLLRRGANANQQNEDDESPRDLAEEFGTHQIRILFRQSSVGKSQNNTFTSSVTFLNSSMDDCMDEDTDNIRGRMEQMNVSGSNASGGAGMYHISGSALRSSLGSGSMSPLSVSPSANSFAFSSSIEAHGWKPQPPMMLSSSGLPAPHVVLHVGH